MKIFLSKWCQHDEVIKKIISPIQSNAIECSTTKVPLARCALNFKLHVRYARQFGTGTHSNIFVFLHTICSVMFGSPLHV